MPTYDYVCESNGRVLEVKHRMSETISTWGELCERAGIGLGQTAANSPVQRLATGGQVVKNLLAEMRSTSIDLGVGGLAWVREPLESGIDALEEATSWLAGAAPNDALAGATPYLRMFGTVIGGWLLATSAGSAARLLEAGSGDAAFLEAKIATAQFYINQLLPQAAGLLPAVTSGVADLIAIGADGL